MITINLIIIMFMITINNDYYYEYHCLLFVSGYGAPAPSPRGTSPAGAPASSRPWPRGWPRRAGARQNTKTHEPDGDVTLISLTVSSTF